MEAFTGGQQMILVLQSLLLGVGIGAVYDVLRAVRLHCRCGRGGTALLDALFWVIVLAALFEFGLLAAVGQPRSFVPAALIGGMSLYFAALSGEVLALLRRVLRAVSALRRRLRSRAAGCSRFAARLCQSEKIRFLPKKFAKGSFLFRGKGIK